MSNLAEFVFDPSSDAQRKKIRQLNIVDPEAHAATALVALFSDNTDAIVITKTNNFNLVYGTNFNGQRICDIRATLIAIKESNTPAIIALAQYCVDNKLTVSFDRVEVAKTSPLYNGKDVWDFAEFENMLHISVENGQNIFSMLNKTGLKIKDKELASAVAVFLGAERRKYVQMVADELAYDKNAIFDWAQFQQDFGFTELDRKVVERTIWAIKRRMRFNEYNRRICLYFFSTQQALGKTEFAKALYSPLKRLTQVMMPESFIDANNFTARECYGPIVDDIDKTDQKNLGAIKSLLTSDEVAQRVFRTQSSATITVNAYPIFTSNRRVEQVMSDTSGNLRYYEIEINRQVFKLLDKYDWQALWKTVDENIVKFWDDSVWAQFTEQAEDQRTRSYFDDFLDAVLIQNHVDDDFGDNIPKIDFDVWYTPHSLNKIFEQYSSAQAKGYNVSQGKLATGLRNTTFKHYHIEFEMHISNPQAIRRMKFSRKIKPVDIDSVFEQVAPVEQPKKQHKPDFKRAWE